MTAPTILTSQGPPSMEDRWTQVFDNSGTNNATIYIGWARQVAGVTPATSAAVWVIKKLSYDVNNMISSVTWAMGDCNIWDNRASLTYV